MGQAKPVAVDLDGNGIWEDESGERYNAGEPLTDSEMIGAGLMDGDAAGLFCPMCAGGYRGVEPPAEIDCDFCEDTGYVDGKRNA